MHEHIATACGLWPAASLEADHTRPEWAGFAGFIQPTSAGGLARSHTWDSPPVLSAGLLQSAGLYYPCLQAEQANLTGLGALCDQSLGIHGL